MMVLKELYRVDEEAQKNFLKEVSFFISRNVISFSLALLCTNKFPLLLFYVNVIGCRVTFITS